LDDASNERFFVDPTGDLARAVVPARGQPYEHRCPYDALQAVAYEVDSAKVPFTLSTLQAATGLPFTQVAVALAFFKERGIAVPAGRRMHISRAGAFEDAMVEYHALREGALGQGEHR